MRKKKEEVRCRRVALIKTAAENCGVTMMYCTCNTNIMGKMSVLARYALWEN